MSDATPASPDEMTAEAFEARLRARPLEPEWSYEILSPAVPAHSITFSTDGGKVSGKHTTEHVTQDMLDLVVDGLDISFKSYAGSGGDELFLTKLRRFEGGIMLGTAERCDVPGNSPQSPIVCKALG